MLIEALNDTKINFIYKNLTYFSTDGMTAGKRARPWLVEKIEA